MTKLENGLSDTRLVAITKHVTEVCADNQHEHCKNWACACDCHE